LDKVPGTTDKAVPLLEDLKAPTRTLVSVSHNLKPLFGDLKPALDDLGPVLNSAGKLLDNTPGLLNSAHDATPDATDAVNYLSKPLNFLRPYTPEAIGWLSNWANVFSSYDSNGHYARIQVQAGPSTPTTNPGVLPPGVTANPYPLPGQNGGTPWTDAYGSGIR
jgi:phospholipid/cholesterol/gamma-HCH transport system substrate-binding protein